ncbi:ABC-three component system protein [Methylobacterium sp. 1030]|uniref:ABC-three component system protein n=1 Tax=Methylobacterium sp. 1030 TaxID=3156404 RepID=UPI0033957688
MPLPIRISHEGGIATFDIGVSLLDRRDVQLCLVQAGPVDIGVIERDGPRPAVVAALTQLFAQIPPGNGTALDHLLPGRAPTLILAPEYALGSQDWAAVDAAVRSSRRTLVLIAGFGVASGRTIEAWLDAGNDRYAAWDREDVGPLGDDNRYGAAWCWVHRPGGGTACIVFLKTFLEQAHETRIARMRRGRSVLRLRLDDIDLFPLICAEVVQAEAPGAPTTRERIRAVLQADGRDALPVLVTASLLQDAPANKNWRRAIDRFVNEVSATRCVRFVTCNQACCPYDSDEEVDRWRSLSGAFGPFATYHRGLRASGGGRPISVPGTAEGVLVRGSGPTIAAGPLTFLEPSPVTALDLWNIEYTLPLTEEGLGTRRAIDEIAEAHELERLTRRLPVEPGWNRRLTEGLEAVRHHLAGTAHPLAKSLLSSLLSGTAGTRIDPDALEPHLEILGEALHGLAALAGLAGLDWHGIEEGHGQLRLDGSGTHVLVWRDPRLGGLEMLRCLEAWARASQPHPRLIVVGTGRRQNLPEGPVMGDRRSDVTEPPADPNDFSLPRTHRAVTCVGLQRVADIYMDGTIPIADAVAALLDLLAAADREAA